LPNKWQTNHQPPRTTAPITKPNGDQTTDPSEKSKILLEQFCPTEREDRKDDRTKLYEQKIQDAMQNKESHPLITQYQSRNWRPTLQDYQTKPWVETGYTTKCLKTWIKTIAPPYWNCWTSLSTLDIYPQTGKRRCSPHTQTKQTSKPTRVLQTNIPRVLPGQTDGKNDQQQTKMVHKKNYYQYSRQDSETDVPRTITYYG
jgi:hypothetical protein